MSWLHGRTSGGKAPIACLIVIVAFVDGACAVYDASSLGVVSAGRDGSSGSDVVPVSDDSPFEAGISVENQSETKVDVPSTMHAHLDAQPVDAPSADEITSETTDADSFAIDDMEDGNASILSRGGRAGAWIAANDGTPGGVQTPVPGQAFAMSDIPGGRNGSTKAVHAISNSAFATWGSQIGFDLNVHFGSESTYDASSFTGLTFWARASTGAVTLRFEVADVQNAPQGGICTVDGGTSKCFDHFGQIEDVTTAWRQFTIPFSTMTQQGFGMHFAAIRSDKLYGCTFLFPPAAPADVWIDDISFY